MKDNKEFFCILKFCRSDLDELLGLIHTTIDECYTGIYPPRAVQFIKEHYSDSEILQKEKAGIVLVAKQGGSLMATGALVGREISGVFVHPLSQRRSFGKRVVRELEKLAESGGHSEVELSASLPSRRFYEHLGYRIIGDIVIDLGDGERLHHWHAKKALK